MNAVTRFFFMACVLLFCRGVAAEVIQVDYEGFTVWVDCDHRGTTRFHYVAHKDSGSLGRHSGYHIDPAIPARCQSKSTDTFQSVLGAGGLSYDVGHQVPANHFDGSAVAIRQTNYWTNLLPQTASMNRGAWRLTEDIVECVRDEVDLDVWGGPIWGDDSTDDYFVESHGMITPSAYWKVVIRTDDRKGMGWIIPNAKASRKSLDKWIKSIEEIEGVTGLTFNAVNKSEKPNTSWKIPKGCSIK